MKLTEIFRRQATIALLTTGLVISGCPTVDNDNSPAHKPYAPAAQGPDGFQGDSISAPTAENNGTTDIDIGLPPVAAAPTNPDPVPLGSSEPNQPLDPFVNEITLSISGDYSRTDVVTEFMNAHNLIGLPEELRETDIDPGENKALEFNLKIVFIDSGEARPINEEQAEIRNFDKLVSSIVFTITDETGDEKTISSSKAMFAVTNAADHDSVLIFINADAYSPLMNMNFSPAVTFQSLAIRIQDNDAEMISSLEPAIFAYELADLTDPFATIDHMALTLGFITNPTTSLAAYLPIGNVESNNMQAGKGNPITVKTKHVPLSTVPEAVRKHVNIKAPIPAL